jgi:hypothetical protein
LKEEFDGKPEDTLQHIKAFNHHCKETGVVEDFKFIAEEYLPPSTVDLTDPAQQKAWLADPDRFTYGNILIDSSSTTIEKMQQARDNIRNALLKFSSPPDPIKMPLASKQLVSFQNREWIYTLLMTVWTSSMKAIMQRYEEVHDQDGVVLWFCFLKHFAGTTTENLIKAYSHLTETKIQLSRFDNNVLQFTNFVRGPICHLIKAKETPTFQHLLHVFHSTMDVPNAEFKAFVINLYTDYQKGGPTKSLSMLDLLDQFDTEYTRINNLGRWGSKENLQILALTASLQTLQSQFSSLQNCYIALTASKDTHITPALTPTSTKLNKPPPHKDNEPEVQEFEGRTWKWCDKCFGGVWNRTHITSEHQKGKGRSKHHQTPPDATPPPSSIVPSPQANLAEMPSPTSQANIANNASFELDFM